MDDLKSLLTETNPNWNCQGQPADIPGSVVVGAGSGGEDRQQREAQFAAPPDISPVAISRDGSRVAKVQPARHCSRS